MRLPGAAAALADIGTVVVIDNVLHDVARAATAVLAEGRAYASTGTYTVGDFRVQKTEAAVKPEGDARDLFSVLWALGNALGIDLPATPDAALGEIAKADAAYEPAWNLLVGEGVRMHLPASPKATSMPVDAFAAPGTGLRVITSRDLYTAADAAALRHPEAEKLHRYDRIQVSEEDGARLGLRDGDEVEISSNGVTISAKATVTERVPEGCVYVSSLLQGGAVVALTGGAAVAGVDLRAISEAVLAR
jgi:predicted molibdopterin-dependent oxidoreductase YjgC